MQKAVFIMEAGVLNTVYPPDVYAAIAERVDILEPSHTRDSIQNHMERLADVDMIFSGWGGPHMDAVFLEHAPKLKAVFYGAGSIRRIVSPAFWQRDILISSAFAINSQPVAHFTYSQIVLALKGVWHTVHLRDRYNRKSAHMMPFPGTVGGTVGIISLGAIGRGVIEQLRSFDLRILAYDPYVSADGIAELGAELCDLETLFRESDVVSLHTPLLDETRGMITGAHFRIMKPHTTFINTARGAVICEDELIAVLQERRDLVALLDVTYPEPPAADSPLWTLPNAIVTPHIAGASSPGEIGAFGAEMLLELDRYLNGDPLKWGVTEQQFEHMA